MLENISAFKDSAILIISSSEYRSAVVKNAWAPLSSAVVSSSIFVFCEHCSSEIRSFCSRFRMFSSCCETFFSSSRIFLPANSSAESVEVTMESSLRTSSLSRSISFLAAIIADACKISAFKDSGILIISAPEC